MRDYLEYDDLHDEKDRLLGRIWGYSHLGMYKEAVDECKKLIKIDPHDPSSFIELGLTYRESGEIEKAIKWYKYTIRRFPKHSHAYINLGYVFEKHKKCDNRAVVCYEKALELDPSDEWALNNIGAILQKEGKWKDALIYYEKAYEASELNGEPNNLILHNLAWAHYHCKNYDKAMALYQQLAHDESDNASIYGDLGCVNYKIGAYVRAWELFDKALSLCPGSRYYKRLYRVSYKKINNK